ncbi:hypothetical protein HYR69_07380, partial [Candidatus Sumerlaeota bacterium]|nr:hypothetical protein [Candidatus Sumerlaeota bacterium]
MSNVGFFTWWKFGRPAAGPVSARGRIGARAEGQSGLEPLIAQNFGPAQELAAIDLGAGDGESPLGRQVRDIPWNRLTAVEAFIPYVHR